MNVILDFQGIENQSVTPDDSPERDEFLQEEGAIEQRAKIMQIELMLKSRYIFRYDIVSDIVGFKLVSKPNVEFQDMKDYNYNSILREIKHLGISCSMTTLRTILKSDFVKLFDPYREYINGLPEWDSETDYICQLAATVHTTNDEFFKICFKKWIVAMIASWDCPRVVNHTALIFSGKQGIGKTMWFSHLIPEPLKRNIYTGKMSVRDKDSLLKLSECPIIIMDELENMGGKNINALKELVTKADIYLRRAFSHTHENYTRRASFAGSVNSKDFLIDATGNRRFLCFETIRIDYQHTVDMDKVFSQAIYLARSGFQYWFTAEEISVLEANNEEFRSICTEEEQLMIFYEPCDRNAQGVMYEKTSDIARSLSQLSGLRISEQKLGRVLNRLNFERFKHNNRYVYSLKLRDRNQVQE